MGLPPEFEDDQWYRSLAEIQAGQPTTLPVTGQRRNDVATVDEVIEAEPPEIPISPAPAAEPPAPEPTSQTTIPLANNLSMDGAPDPREQAGALSADDFPDPQPPKSAAAAVDDATQGYTPSKPTAAPEADTSKPVVDDILAGKLDREQAPEAWHSSLVSTKPSWYSDEAPPDEPTALKALLGLGTAGLMAALAPDGKSAAAAGLGGLLQTGGALIDDPQKNYQRRLQAAKTQSDMNEKLNAGRGGGAQGLGWANYDLAVKRFEAGQKSEAEKAARLEAMQDINSPITKQYQDAAIATQVLPEAEARKMTAFQIDEFRPQAGASARQSQGFSNSKELKNIGHDQAVERIGIQNNLGIQGEQRAEARKIGGEERERVAKLEEAHIPGYEIASGRAPSTTDVARAREMTIPAETALYAVQQLKEIQGKLSAWRVAGKAYEWFADDPEAQQALADAKWAQKLLMDSQRELSRLGVLQQFEKTMTEATNPEAGTLDEYFTGPRAYEAYEKMLPGALDTRLRVYGYVREQPKAPNSSARSRPAPKSKNIVNDLNKDKGDMAGAGDRAIDAGKMAVNNAAETAGKVAGAVGEAAAPAVDAAAQAGAKMYKIVLKTGKEIRRALTPEQLEKAKQAAQSIVPE